MLYFNKLFNMMKKYLISKYLDKKLKKNDKNLANVIMKFLECQFCNNLEEDCPNHYCRDCKVVIYECECVICKNCNKYNMVYDQCTNCMKEICKNCVRTCVNGCGTVICERCQDNMCRLCDDYISHLTF